MILQSTRVLRSMNIGVMLLSLIGVNAEAIAQEDSIEEAAALNQEVGDLYVQGRYEDAIPRAERALAIREKALGPKHPGTARLLNNLAGLYRATGAYAQAEPLYQWALAITEKVLGPEHPQTALVLNNLAGLYRAMGAYAQTESLYQRALAVFENVLGSEHPRTAAALTNLAALYHDTGAYAKAEPLYQRALAITEKALGPEHPHTAAARNNLARLYHDTGAYAKAEPLYQRALAITEKALGPEHPHTAAAFNNLAIFRWAMNDAAAALPLFERRHAIERKNVDRFLLTGSESRKRMYLDQLRGSTFVLISLSRALSGPRATRLGFTSVLQIKGRVLDAMSENVGHLRQSVKPEDRALFDELTALTQQQSALRHQGLGNLQPEAYRQRLQELSARQEQLEAELSTRSAEFRQQIAPVTLAAVQAAIPEGAVLIEWYRYGPYDPKGKDGQSRWGKSRYVVYVLRHEGEPVVVDVGEADTIEQMIHDFRVGLSDSNNTYVEDVAKELYGRLLKPLEQHLGKVNHLLISPDGALNLVPFAALRDEKGKYFGAKLAITYLTSGRDLLRFGTTPSAQSKVVLVADPDYGSTTNQADQIDRVVLSSRSLDLDRGEMVFSPLPGTAEEAKTLKALLKISDDQVLAQAKATEDRFKAIQSPRILHVATHGFFRKDHEFSAAALKPVGFLQDQVPGPVGENPLLRSGLALAGANQRRSGEKDDGILTAAEVAQMDLRGTQLVVLSACETGVGDVQNGEGVYGLRRALVLAGAETQVTSLWKVSDEATKDLMVDYYQRLLKGEGRSEALRNTQLTMMKSKDRSHPYYWAAFVPIGNWTPLAKGR